MFDENQADAFAALVLLGQTAAERPNAVVLAEATVRQVLARRHADQALPTHHLNSQDDPHGLLPVLAQVLDRWTSDPEGVRRLGPSGWDRLACQLASDAWVERERSHPELLERDVVWADSHPEAPGPSRG